MRVHPTQCCTSGLNSKGLLSHCSLQREKVKVKERECVYEMNFYDPYGFCMDTIISVKKMLLFIDPWCNVSTRECGVIL